jgi:hypothetical protein
MSNAGPSLRGHRMGLDSGRLEYVPTRRNRERLPGSPLPIRAKRAALAALAVFLLAGFWVHRSEPYRIVSVTITDPRLQSMAGNLRFRCFTRASINFSERQTSRTTFNILGTREIGWYQVWFRRHDGNFFTSRILFNGKEFPKLAQSVCSTMLTKPLYEYGWLALGWPLSGLPCTECNVPPSGRRRLRFPR